jgi:hypothetical protein
MQTNRGVLDEARRKFVGPIATFLLPELQAGEKQACGFRDVLLRNPNDRIRIVHPSRPLPERRTKFQRQIEDGHAGNDSSIKVGVKTPMDEHITSSYAVTPRVARLLIASGQNQSGIRTSVNVSLQHRSADCLPGTHREIASPSRRSQRAQLPLQI